MRSRAVRHAGRCIGLVAIVGAPAIANAQDIRTSMTASVGGSAETNPYSEVNPSGAAIAATAELRPSLTVRDELTTIDVNASAQFRQFLRRYGLEDNYSIGASIVRRQADWLTLRATDYFTYNRGGYNAFGRPSLSTPSPIETNPNPTEPVPAINPVTGLTDVNLLGQRTRVTSYGSGVGADFVLGARTSLSVDLNASAMRFKSTAFNNYNTLHGELHLSHQLNEAISVGVIGGYGKTNYLDLGQGDAGTSDALVSVDAKLGARWNISASVGGSFTTIEARAGRPEVHYSSITTRLRLCWQGEFSQFCLGGQRSPQPTADGNVRVSSTLNADYSIRVSDRERISVNGSYAKTGRTRDLLGTQPAIDFVAASARYDNQLTNKLTAFVSTNFAKTYTANVRRKANLGIAVGLQYSFGAGQ